MKLEDEGIYPTREILSLTLLQLQGSGDGQHWFQPA